MIKKILKAKHWQLFLLGFVIPMVLYMYSMSTMLEAARIEINPDPMTMLKSLKLLPIVLILTTGTIYAWYWSVAIGLQEAIPDSLRLNTNRFKVALFFPLLYLLVIAFFVFAIMNGSWGFDPANTVSYVFTFMGFFFTLNILVIFCSFYVLYFIAKTIKTAELKREVSFSDYVGEFLLVWFYPIGIWILQPKISEIAADNSFTDDVVK